jgi:hypothetical protein
MKITDVADRAQEILVALSEVIVGKAEVLERILAGIVANGHVLIEDYPGLAKTLIARLFAQATDLGFKRIQFTPDLLPSDITGSFLYDQREGRFEFRRGPVFTNLLLADEINRATPKTQAARLEAMQEAQVTVEGERFPLDPPFLVIATQNPIELEGTYPLPEAQLDRFLLRISVGYPGREEEREVLARRRGVDEIQVQAVVSRAQLRDMQGVTYVAKDLALVPPRVLSPRSLVIALSPLLDARFIKAASDLAARGFEVVIVSVSPVDIVRACQDASVLVDAACRLWDLERQGRLAELRRQGLRVIEWHPDEPLDLVLAQLGRHRRLPGLVA